jgi:hypothetical protein
MGASNGVRAREGLARCDTFTVTDAYSRFILYCQAVPNLNHEEVDKICDALMAEYGVPERIRTDNGTPFCSMSGFGVSRLSLKWAQLGIVHERIAPRAADSERSPRTNA